MKNENVTRKLNLARRSFLIQAAIMALGFTLIFVGVLGIALTLGFLISGCTSSSRAQSEALVTQQHQEELQLRHEARCQEMLIDGDIVSLRGWCATSSTRIRPSQRQHACELVEEYERYCTP